MFAQLFNWHVQSTFNSDRWVFIYVYVCVCVCVYIYVFVFIYIYIYKKTEFTVSLMCTGPKKSKLI